MKLLVSHFAVTVMKNEASSVVSGLRESGCETSCSGGNVFPEGGNEESTRQ